MQKTIITISRQFGAGGRELGKKLAGQLNVPYYDKELLSKAAKDSGLTQEFIEHYDEKHTSSLLYNLVMTPHLMLDSFGTSWEDMAVKATKEAILSAAENSCVIVGRNADFILRNEAGLFRIFITANEEQRIARIVARDKVSAEEAEKKMYRMDKARAANYSYYTNQNWGQAENYDLCLNLSKISLEKAIRLIVDCVNERRTEK